MCVTDQGQGKTSQAAGCCPLSNCAVARQKSWECWHNTYRLLGTGPWEEVQGMLGIVHRNILMCKPVSCALGREAVPATDNVPHRGHHGGQVLVLPEGVCASCSTLHIFCVSVCRDPLGFTVVTHCYAPSLYCPHSVLVHHCLTFFPLNTYCLTRARSKSLSGAPFHSGSF